MSVTPQAPRRRGFLITDRPHTPAGTVAIALFGGGLLGLAAWALHSVLPQPWNTLANTSALWGLVPMLAVLIQRAQRTLAAVTGVAALLGMVLLYALASAASPRQLALYLVVGVAAGALFGLAATLIGSPRRGHLLLAAGVLGGIIAGEGLYGVVVVAADGPQWWYELALGLAIAITIGRGLRGRMLALAAAGAVAAALLGVFALYDAVMVG